MDTLGRMPTSSNEIISPYIYYRPQTDLSKIQDALKEQETKKVEEALNQVARGGGGGGNQNNNNNNTTSGNEVGAAGSEDDRGPGFSGFGGGADSGSGGVGTSGGPGGGNFGGQGNGLA